MKFDWGEEEEDSFQKLKEAITEAPLLVYPQEGGEFVLDTDASDKAIGAVLSQVQDGKERVVAYGSFVLSTAQRNYCVTRRELLAIVVFTKHFRHYLLGSKFKVRTDHNSLIWLMRFKNNEGQLARWIEELQNYDMELLYRADVWKCIWVVNKIMSAVLLEIKNNKKVCVVHHDTIKKCGDSDFPRWVERLRGQIKEREGAKEGSREDKNVGTGEGEGELSSVAGEEIVDEISGGDGGHSPEDEGRLADAESSSDTLAYEGGIGQKYVKKQKRKRKVPKWLDQYVWDSEE